MKDMRAEYEAPQQGMEMMRTAGAPLPVGPGIQPMPNPNKSSYNPQYPYGLPGSPVDPMGGDGFLTDLFAGYGLSDASKYGDENFRNLAEGYANYYAIPYGNLQLAERTQGMNEKFGTFDRNEQQRINNLQYALQRAAAQREDEALRFGQQTNVRDFGETQRQFDVTSGQNQFNLDTQRQQVNNQNAIAREQNRIAQYEAETGRIDVEGRRKLEQFANETARMNVNNQYQLGVANVNQARYATDTEAGTQRRGQDFQRELGLGQLGFQNRELDVNDAYRRQALGQEADLTREKMRSDEMNQRYATFGRAAAPNFRAAQSWY